MILDSKESDISLEIAMVIDEVFITAAGEANTSKQFSAFSGFTEISANEILFSEADAAPVSLASINSKVSFRINAAICNSFVQESHFLSATALHFAPPGAADMFQ